MSGPSGDVTVNAGGLFYGRGTLPMDLSPFFRTVSQPAVENADGFPFFLTPPILQDGCPDAIFFFFFRPAVFKKTAFHAILLQKKPFMRNGLENA